MQNPGKTHTEISCAETHLAPPPLPRLAWDGSIAPTWTHAILHAHDTLCGGSSWPPQATPSTAPGLLAMRGSLCGGVSRVQPLLLAPAAQGGSKGLPEGPDPAGVALRLICGCFEALLEQFS